MPSKSPDDVWGFWRVAPFHRGKFQPLPAVSLFWREHSKMRGRIKTWKLDWGFGLWLQTHLSILAFNNSSLLNCYSSNSCWKRFELQVHFLLPGKNYLQSLEQSTRAFTDGPGLVSQNLYFYITEERLLYSFHNLFMDYRHWLLL